MKRFKRFVVNELPSQVAGMVLGLIGSVALLFVSLWLASGVKCADVQSIKVGAMLMAGCN